MMNLDDKISKLIEPVIRAMGYELWGCELHQSGRHTLLRVYIDFPIGDVARNIGLDDCSKVSEQIGALLDVADPIGGAYSLEVSSPGLDRGLFKFEHFVRYVGELVNVRLLQPEHGRRNFKGRIKSVTAGELELLVDNVSYRVALANITKANLCSLD